MNKKVIIFSFTIVFALVSKGYSQTLVVEDLSNLIQNSTTAVSTAATLTETIKQYQTLVEQYDLMVKDMAAPYFWVFQEMQDFEGNIDYYKDKYSRYNDESAWEAHFATYLDPSTYSSSPCFQFGGCSQE